MKMLDTINKQCLCIFQAHMPAYVNPTVYRMYAYGLMDCPFSREAVLLPVLISISWGKDEPVPRSDLD